MIKDILGDPLPSADVEPVDPGCGCACQTKSAANYVFADAAVS